MSTLPLTQFRRAARRRDRRGFTLTELMVSLVMGLIVALAAVGLARNATTTFHEQARTSVTEMSIRTASERLKLDLMRTSYMSTGNIILDPNVATILGTSPSRFNATNTLRGLRIDPGMQTSDGGAPGGITANGLSPDSIELTGNFTTDDYYSGVITSGNGGLAGGNCTNPQSITLDPAADAAVYNLGGGTSTVNWNAGSLAANATAAFLPDPLHPMLAQVIDANGCANYVPVCNVGVSGSKLIVNVDAQGNKRAVLYSNSPAGFYETPPGLNKTCGASENGRVTIAPLQTVRWSIQPSQAALATDPSWGEDAKTDLVRQVLDFNGAPVGGAEVIAEYAVDLKFGIVYDARNTSGVARQVVDDLDSDNGGGDIYKTTAGPDSIKSTSPGPQRVRAVKYRIAIRTGMADRDNDLATGAGQFRARFCVATAGGNTSTCVKWARVRTVVSEVGLTNQTRMTY